MFSVRYLKNIKFWWRCRAAWSRARAVFGVSAAQGGGVLIVPCDPWAVVGSRGDQAMALACIQHIREQDPDRIIDIVTDDETTHADCRALGLVPQATWTMPMDRWFAEYGRRYAEVYILGADVTDGVYGWGKACRLLMYYDLFASAGIEVHYLGFSWSQTPSYMMRRVLRHLTDGLPLYVRDPVSYERVAKFTKHRPLIQVADVAFCLQPRISERVVRRRAWIAAQKAAGKRVIAINVHTMFNQAETRSDDWEHAFVDALKAVRTHQADIAWLLVPHDNRAGISDQDILARIYRRLDEGSAYFVNEVMDADEIKALISSCDGLIAGRMHISIAALGSGVPVFGLVYQGKFEGLWQFFDLPKHTLVSPEKFLKTPELAMERLSTFMSRLPELRRQIGLHLPAVLELSRKNFERP